MRTLALTFTTLIFLAYGSRALAQDARSGFSQGPGATQGGTAVAAVDARQAISPNLQGAALQTTLNRSEHEPVTQGTEILFSSDDRRGETQEGQQQIRGPSTAAQADTVERLRNPSAVERATQRGGASPTRAAVERLALGAPKLKSNPQQAAETSWLDLQANKSISTVLTGLSIVLGIFLLLAWAVRKRMPQGSAKLPDEIIEVLGRTTLAAKQSLHLVRVGGKLIVVSVTAAGTETLTEINEPTEVARILASCQQHHTQSSTAAFRQVLEQLGREPADGFLGTELGPGPHNRNGGRVA